MYSRYSLSRAQATEQEASEMTRLTKNKERERLATEEHKSPEFYYQQNA
jgi:hypothetical protein